MGNLKWMRSQDTGCCNSSPYPKLLANKLKHPSRHFRKLDTQTRNFGAEAGDMSGRIPAGGCSYNSVNVTKLQTQSKCETNVPTEVI